MTSRSIRRILRAALLVLVAFSYVTILRADEVTIEEEGESSTDSEDQEGQKIENGIYALSSLTDVRSIIDSLPRNEEAYPAIVCLVLLYDPECPHSETMTLRVETAYEKLIKHFQSTSDDLENFLTPIFAKMSVNDASKEVLDSIGVTSVPSLLLVRDEGEDKTFMLEYTGLKGSGEEIFQAFLHYFYSLVVKSNDVRYTPESIDVYPRQFLDLKEVLFFVRSHREFLFNSPTSEPMFPPSMTDEEVGHNRWLLEEEGGQVAGDDFVVLVQCRRLGGSEADAPDFLYRTFDSMSQVLTNRRDRLFLSTLECTPDHADGSVTAWKIPMDWSFEHLSTPDLPHCTSPRPTGDDETDSQKLIEFMVKVSTPSILWFDRQATAPIAFPRYRKVHAVLFVDVHHTSGIPPDPDNDAKSLMMRSAIRQFRQACREKRRGEFGGTCNDSSEEEDSQTSCCGEKDMVCLIVPSTETRVMTTFGVDMWTPLDKAITEFTEEEPVLPAVLMTDQRFGGTLRYYLDAHTIRDSPPTRISDFIRNFWMGNLNPRVKSSSTPRTTESGVQIVTAETMKQALHLKEGSLHHALLYFTAPACGHCKRFSVVWKQLAELLQHVEWTHFLKLYQVDVTTDDLVVGLNVTVRWLPDLYYLTPDRHSVIRFNETDDMGDDVGRISSPMEILAWFLAKGEFENEQVVEKLLEDLENKF